MRDRITEALTRRRLGGAVLLLDRITAILATRARLVGAGLLLAGVIVAMIVLWPSGDDDEKSPPPRATAKPLPVRIVSVPPLGLGFVHPRTWTRAVHERVISLRSPDRSIELFISSPYAKPARDAAKSVTQTALRERFAPARVVRDGPEKLGGRTVASFELVGENKGKPIRALVLVGSTDYRTYVVTMLTGEHPSQARLREARRILSTVRFGKPVAPSR